MWDEVFKLYDRDQSGFADQSDVLAALLVSGRSEDYARRMINASGEGNVDFERFKALIEESVALSLGRDFDGDLSHQHAVCARHL